MKNLINILEIMRFPLKCPIGQKWLIASTAMFRGSGDDLWPSTEGLIPNKYILYIRIKIV